MAASLPKPTQKQLKSEPEVWLRSACRAAKNEGAIEPVLRRYEHIYQTWEPVHAYMLRACLVNVVNTWKAKQVSKKYCTNSNIAACVDEIVSVAAVLPIECVGQGTLRGRKRKREHGDSAGKCVVDERDVGIWLSEVQFFLKDMYGSASHGLRQLLAICSGKFEEDMFVRGDETLDSDCSVLDCMLRKVKFEHMGNHLAAVITGVTASDRALLERLVDLRFHCHGHIQLFDHHASKNVFASYVKHLQDSASQFFFLEDLTPIASYEDPMLLAHAVGLVLFFVTPNGDMRLWLVFDGRRKRKEWVCVGGRVCMGVDDSIEQAIIREWEEEMPGHPWVDSIDGPIIGPIHNEANGMCIDGIEYACQPVFLAKASRAFYEITSAHAEYLMPLPSSGYVRIGDCPRPHHTDGLPYIEKEEGAWFDVDLDPTSMMLFRQGRGRDRICQRDAHMLKRVYHTLDYQRRICTLS